MSVTAEDGGRFRKAVTGVGRFNSPELDHVQTGDREPAQTQGEL